MQTLLLVAELVIAVALVIFIMLQRSEGGALGMGGGGGGGMGGLFSPRGAADTLTRTTAILAALFFLTCIGLDLLAGRPAVSTPESLLSGPGSSAPVQQRPAQPVVPLPTGPQVPKPQ
jgi:preprotein translocase subunit SecG